MRLQAAAQRAVETAGVRQVAARLAALEGVLPLGAQRDASWGPWAAWRSALAAAETPSQLAPLVRALSAPTPVSLASFPPSAGGAARRLLRPLGGLQPLVHILVSRGKTSAAVVRCAVQCRVADTARCCSGMFSHAGCRSELASLEPSTQTLGLLLCTPAC